MRVIHALNDLPLKRVFGKMSRKASITLVLEFFRRDLFRTHTFWNGRIDEIRPLILCGLGGGFWQPFRNSGWIARRCLSCVELELASFAAGGDPSTVAPGFVEPGDFDDPATDRTDGLAG